MDRQIDNDRDPSPVTLCHPPFSFIFPLERRPCEDRRSYAKQDSYGDLVLFAQETIRLPNNSCGVAARQSGGAYSTRPRRIQGSRGRAGCKARGKLTHCRDREEHCIA